MKTVLPLLFSQVSISTNFDTVNTVFPYVYEIGYVRVYQKKMDCDNSKTYCNVNAVTYESKVYEDLTVGGSGCTADISTDHTSCLATDYVILDEGFTIDGSTEAYIDVLDCEVQTASQEALESQQPPASFLKRMQYKAAHQ